MAEGLAALTPQLPTLQKAPACPIQMELVLLPTGLQRAGGLGRGRLRGAALRLPELTGPGEVTPG